MVAVWLLALALCAGIVARTRFSTDLSAFLPQSPTREQQVLLDQLRDGAVSRLILTGIDGADSATRAALSQALAQRLRDDPLFSAVSNGEPVNVERDRAFLFGNRYLLSPAVDAARFSIAGLHAAIGDSIDLLNSPAGLLAKPLLARDPTGELLQLLGQIDSGKQPRRDQGVWVSRDGARAVLLLQTVAAGADIDAQQSAMQHVRQAFADARLQVAQQRAAPAAPAPSSATASTGSTDSTASTASTGSTASTASSPSSASSASPASPASPGSPASTAAAAAGNVAAARLVMTGPGVFSVAARDTIKSEVTRLSIISSLLIVCLLLAVYRSFVALALGLLPVVSGALAGVAAVSLGFGVVHGITLGFGTTLIGEAVDYSIYLFVQSRQSTRSAPSAAIASRANQASDLDGAGVPSSVTSSVQSTVRMAGANGAGAATLALTPDDAASHWVRAFWPTVRLGVLTSIVGFSSLLLSRFPGLAQLGLYSIAGLIAAALVTRFVLPLLLPADFRIGDVGALAQRLLGLAQAAPRLRWPLLILTLAAAVVLVQQRATLLDPELASLSPVAPAEQRLDASLRADLGAPDVRYMVVINAADREAALRASERVALHLAPLVADGTLAGFDTPSRYLPSISSQRARQLSLPPTPELETRLVAASVGLPVRATVFQPFLADVAAARSRAPLQRQDLDHTSLALAVDAMLFQRDGRWSAVLPLTAKADTAAGMALSRVRAALAAAAQPEALFIDLKAESDKLYSGYLRQAVRLSLAGLVAIALLLLIALRSPLRVARVLLPLISAVILVVAGLTLSGHRLTILHLVGLLLIVAVGSNYALFFGGVGRHGRDTAVAPQTLFSLVFANMTTVVGFGLLAFSTVPVLQAIGSTVGPGAVLALLLAASFAAGPQAPVAPKAAALPQRAAGPRPPGEPGVPLDANVSLESNVYFESKASLEAKVSLEPKVSLPPNAPDAPPPPSGALSGSAG